MEAAAPGTLFQGASLIMAENKLAASEKEALSAAASDRWISLDCQRGLVTVIIPTYNRSDLIRETLKSVVAQQYRPIELIVVDDGSRDNTRAVVEEYIAAVHEDLTVRYIYQDNAGAPAARNRGTRAASGEFLQYLDSDDLLDREKIEHQVTALRSADWAAFAYGPIRELENPARTIYCQSEMSWERMLRKSIVTPAMQTAGPLSRRSMIAKIGPWNEKIAPMEDWEYFTRAVVSGLQGVYAPRAITLHRMDVPDRLRWTGKPGTVERFVLGRIGQLESVLAHACNRARFLPGFHDLIAWNLLQVGAFGVTQAWGGDERNVYNRASQVSRGLLVRTVAGVARALSNRSTRTIVAAAILSARWIYFRTIYKLSADRLRQPRSTQQGTEARTSTDALVYVADRDGMGSIFESAYLVPARLLQSPKQVTGVMALMSIGTSLKPPLRRRWSEKLGVWRPTVNFLWSYPTLTRPTISRMFDRTVINRAFRKVHRRFRPRRVVASTGSARFMPILAELRRSGRIDWIVYHVWGPDAEEHAFAAQHNGERPPNRLKTNSLSIQQRKAISLADAVISISGDMTRWLTDEMQAEPDIVFEIPWLADATAFERSRDNRDQIRSALDFADAFVLGYSGSMLAWQLEAAAVAKIATAARKIHKRVVFLGLSMHREALRRTLLESGFKDEDIKVFSVAFSEAPKYLSAMDLGIVGRNLFRPPELVNQLSSPVKFGEYLLSGVPVALSDALEDLASITRTENVGVVVSEHATTDAIARDLVALFSKLGTTRLDLSERCVRAGKIHTTYQSRMATYASAHSIQLDAG